MNYNYHFVYLVTNLINKKQYIGDHSSDILNDGYLGGGKPYLQNALMKYGRKNFKREILEFFSTKQEAFNAQEKYIKQYNTLNPNGYNISPKGGHGISGCFSEETLRKISEKNKISLKGKKLSEETKKKISKSNTGKKRSEEAKNNYSIAKCQEKHPMFGKEISKEIKEKISSSLKGRKKTEEQIRKSAINRRKISDEMIKNILKLKEQNISAAETKKLYSNINIRSIFSIRTNNFKRKIN
jgi:group I intron endonuclease